MRELKIVTSDLALRYETEEFGADSLSPSPRRLVRDLNGVTYKIRSMQVSHPYSSLWYMEYLADDFPFFTYWSVSEQKEDFVESSMSCTVSNVLYTLSLSNPNDV